MKYNKGGFVMSNEAFERVSLEQAFKCALTKATQLYLDGKDEFASERFFRGVYGDDYLVYIESTDLNTIGLSYRKPALPEGDLGVSVAEFQLDSMSREKLLEAMYTLTKILDA